MLENARRQLMIVIATVTVAILLLSFLSPNYGLDLEGGVQLIYEVDPHQVVADGILPENPTDQQIAQLMDTTVQIINERIDPQGTREAVVTRRGLWGILIELPKLTEAESATVENQIQSLGRLEFRMLAYDQYVNQEHPDVKFNVRQERTRLEDWLKADDFANRKLVEKDPQAINEFNRDGTLSKSLRWFPKLITPRLDDPTKWYQPESLLGGDESPAVAAYSTEEWNNGVVPEAMKSGDARPYLVEFLPINMDARSFTGKDLDPTSTRSGIGDNGKPAIHYKMRPQAVTAYADFSGEYKGQRCAIIFNNTIFSAPTFMNRIAGPAEISSESFTQREVDSLVKTLNTGSLPVKPIRNIRSDIGATLGARSIQLAALSIAIGGIVLLAFVLWYYRIAGLIACAALMMNVLLIMAVVVFLRATLTLPGLSGLVLTMGMAIDSNILIYERIREELERGKEMLQACRAGFERAIATIIDANLTTFLAGLVLFIFGVGPVRGFAVTLMVGIATTLFTAYFVTRLMFHYMLERQALGSLRFAAWLKNANYDFMSKRKLWVGISVVFILFGLIEFARTSPDEKYAIDFTGGANLTVVLRESQSPDQIRDLLAKDDEFHKKFPAPIVNTIAQDQDGKARRFSIRVKLTDALRAEIDAARAANPTDYQPPYVTGLERALSNLLVPEAFSGIEVFRNNSGSSDYAEISLHFVDTVPVDSLQKSLVGLAGDVKVRDLDDKTAATGRNFKIEFGVPKETDPKSLPNLVQERLRNLKGPDNKPVLLSNPIPEYSDIGGRMVGELRTAAIDALFIAMFAIVLYIRVRFNEFKYGIAAVASLIHDVLVTLGFVVLFNSYGLVDAEIDLSMIAAFLTIIGYSINDTIVIFDRVRENLSDAARLGQKVDRVEVLNRSINQTLSRTVLTTLTTMFVIVAQFVVNFHAGTALEGFSFALLVGMISGTYSTVFIASPLVLWLWQREERHASSTAAATTPSTPIAPAGS
ncbi:MAG: protein translocase subunit SecD [Planctomycetota bacterium]